MCGVAGFVGRPGTQDANVAVAAMCEQMRLRGPDDNGVEDLSSPAGQVVLGSTRLAIIDPSPSGHQPMRDRERGTTVVFNGMIYNFRELRAELESAGEHFRSDCDTEVVLRAYGRWGRAGIRRLHGMYAFAIWDEREGTLLLARDRVGIKPLYYVDRDGTFAFASAVKALLAGGVAEPRLSRVGIETYLAYGAVSEPHTAIEGVSQLPAGTMAEFRDGRLSVECYWEPPAVEESIGPQEMAAELHETLGAAVRSHLVSDAPLGVFLSGGLDSSLIAALAAREVADVRTVSVAFDDPSYSEAAFMDRVARAIGSDHVSILLRPAELLSWLDDAFEAMDQPTFDGINTYVVSRGAAETGLKVALSGLGADELFDGYGYVRRVRMLRRAGALPPVVGRVAASVAAVRGGRDGKAAAWLSGEAAPASPYELLRGLFLRRDIASLLANAPSANGALSATPGPAADLYGEVSRLDLANYMRNVLLRDTDAMSMGNSLEVRVPFLDDAVVDWALRRSAAVKGERKAVLAQIARDLVPKEIVERRKHGFLLPLAQWMRTDLQDEVAGRLLSPPAALDNVIVSDAVEHVWRSFNREGGSWLKPWALYSLHRWAETL